MQKLILEKPSSAMRSLILKTSLMAYRQGYLDAMKLIAGNLKQTQEDMDEKSKAFMDAQYKRMHLIEKES